MKKAIVNGELFIGNRFYKDRVLVFENEKIVDILDASELEKEYRNIEVIDAKGCYVTPGFIDLQLNGCGGVLFNDDISEKTLEIMYKTNLKFGCTSFTPTLITTSDENILKAFIRATEDKIIDRIIEAGKENVRIITLAPEKTDKKVISKLHKAGINVALGHTNGTYEELKEKEGYGVTLATHLYNGMSSFNHRNPGAVGAIFDSDICAGIIVDGFHCHYSAIKSAIKIMGERLFLVTDAVSPVGTDMEYFYFEGNKVYYKDGKCFGEDGTLGGSALTMDMGVKNLVKHCDITLEEAIRMATLYPAKAVKIDDRYGKLQPDYFADIVFLDKHLNLKKVIAKGIEY